MLSGISLSVFSNVILYFCTVDAEDFLTLINPKMSDENVSKTQTVSDSDPQSGLSGKEKDRLPNSGLLDHFTKIFLYCRRAMVRWSFVFAYVVDMNLSP